MVLEEIKGQTSLLENMEQSEEEKLIEKILLRGTGFAGGKERIYNIIKSDISRSEKVKAIMREYGEGGSSDSHGIRNSHSPSGKTFQLRDMNSKEYRYLIDISLSWNEVIEIIEKLIKLNIYVS